jgi:hypothetical protein
MFVWEKNGTVRAISTPPTSPAQSAKIKAISYDAELDLGGDETNYDAFIARAVAGHNAESRRAIYERARAALVAQLRSAKPTLNERDITDERLKLESSIRKAEAESVRRWRRGWSDLDLPDLDLPDLDLPKGEKMANKK